MNKRQKLVQERFLDNEEAVIKELKAVYKDSLETIDKNIKELEELINENWVNYAFETDQKTKEVFESMMQSKVYQKQYQEALRKQVASVLDNLQTEEFKTISDYMRRCYDDGYIGTMFDFAGQGIPVLAPMDAAAIVRAVQLDSKLSDGLYARLGEDVKALKTKISAQVARGISTGKSHADIARQIAAETNIGYNNAVRIARTEGHRIQIQSTMDAGEAAKEKGADVLKQWDSTLDGATRKAHKKVDGEIREMDEPFSNGLMFPGDPGGGASEVVNCRCALLQRARWALDEKELETLRERAKFFELDKEDNFDEFKRKYLAISDTGITEAKTEKQFTNALKREPPTEELKQKRSAVSEYMRNLGADVDNDGNVTLYHATAKENVPLIKENGFRPTDAPLNGSAVEKIEKRVFFGYDKEWVSDTWSSDGAYEVMKIKIPAEYIHMFGANTLEVVVEGVIKDSGGGVWLPDILPTSTAWDRRTVKRWLKKQSDKAE